MRPEYIKHESVFYGRAWDYIHHGYFSNPEVARPILVAVVEAARRSQPSVLADIGGGTGFLLRQLHSSLPGLKCLNVDPAHKQLMESDTEFMVGLEKTAQELTRDDLAGPADRLLLLMRSLLHYFGRDGLEKVIQIMRRVAIRDEYLVHQSACFEEQRDADCLNVLYSRMNTDKWYTIPADLCAALENCGWLVEAVSPAPPLPLESSELIKRYGVPPWDMEMIAEELRAEFGPVPGVFEPRAQSDFTAYLHYRIFTCRAV